MPDRTAGTLERQVNKLEVEPASGVVCCSAALNRVSTGTGKWRAWIIPGHAWEEARGGQGVCKEMFAMINRGT